MSTLRAKITGVQVSALSTGCKGFRAAGSVLKAGSYYQTNRQGKSKSIVVPFSRYVFTS